MPFPLSAHVTFANGTVVDPSYLNDYETYIVGLYAATRSVKSLYIGGTGGTAVSPAKGRLYLRGGGQPTVTLHANWGAGAAAAFTATSSDAWGAFRITTGAGTGANPTVEVTYSADGTWTTTPLVMAWLVTTSGTAFLPGTAALEVNGLLTTSFIITFYDTPAAGGAEYWFRYLVIG